MGLADLISIYRFFVGITIFKDCNLKMNASLSEIRTAILPDNRLAHYHLCPADSQPYRSDPFQNHFQWRAFLLGKVFCPSFCDHLKLPPPDFDP
jgi:hypothetical protein